MTNAENDPITPSPIVSGKDALASLAGTAPPQFDAHPDVFLLAVCAELVAIEADTENRVLYEDRRAKLKKNVLGLEAVTLDGCRARLQAMEAAWPDILEQLHGSPKRQQDEVYWRDYKRLPSEETGAMMRSRLKARSDAKAYPPITPAQVVERARRSASERAACLFEGLGVLEAIAGDDGGVVEINAHTLEWLVKRFKKDANDIQTDLDYAERSLDGDIYPDAHVRYAGAE